MTSEKLKTVETTTDHDRELVEPLNKVLDKLRPIFHAEGGDAVLLAVRDGVAHIAFGGGCEGCGGATSGMEGGLRLMLLERVTGLKEVIFE